MNYQNFPVVSQNDNTLLWGYAELTNQLAETFCMCPPVADITPSLNKYCDFQTLKSCAYLSSPKILCDTDSSMQKELTDLFIYKKQQTPQMTRVSESISFPKTNMFKNEGLTDTSEKAEVIKKRRRRSSRLEIRSKLIEVRDQILQQGIPMFYNSPKKTRGSPISNSRRSKYIGISKNNTHWQALINIGRTKKYIDIFVSEQEAARTYDVYAIAIKGVDANLNFNYTAAEMISMIDHYLQHGSAVVPS